MKKKVVIIIILALCVILLALLLYNMFSKKPRFEDYNQTLETVDQEEDNKNVEDVRTLFLNSNVLPENVSSSDILDCMRVSDYYILYVNKSDTELYLVTYKDKTFKYDIVLKSGYIQGDIPENEPNYAGE